LNRYLPYRNSTGAITSIAIPKIRLKLVGINGINPKITMTPKIANRTANAQSAKPPM
jgi:hypothetical protein